jgi:hypothetical protein
MPSAEWRMIWRNATTRCSPDVPIGNLVLHVCLRAPDGLIVVDTCPSEEAFQAFHHGEAFRSLRAKLGLPDPDRVDDFPVHVAFAGGAAVASGY